MSLWLDLVKSIEMRYGVVVRARHMLWSLLYSGALGRFWDLLLELVMRLLEGTRV